MAQPPPDIVWSEQTHNNYIAPVAFAPDGTSVATVETSNSIRLANLADGSVVRYLFGHMNSVTALAFSPDGSVKGRKGFLVLFTRCVSQRQRRDISIETPPTKSTRSVRSDPPIAPSGDATPSGAWLVW